MFFKKTIDGILEVVSCNDKLETLYNRFRHIQEDGIPIHGFVTVIKNEGRSDEEIIQEGVENLLTTTGRDLFIDQVYINVIPGTRGGNIIAVSDDAADPVAGITDLAGEITTNGLARALGILGHSPGTNVTTITKIFTATGGTFTGIHKSALFNNPVKLGPPTDRITHAREFDADVDLQVGDTLTVIWTCTLG